MKQYGVIFSIEARDDIESLKQYIKQELKLPETAANYIKDLTISIRQLSCYAASIGANPHIQAKFGVNARHITFKKMAIVYVIKNNTVYIKRIIPCSMVY